MLRLVIANLNYSSWSMRPWLALKHAGAEFRCHDVRLKTESGWKERILQFSGAGNVPILVDGSLSVHESLAICEYAAELYPQAKLWPEARELRARGRAISCEMHAGFVSLRSELAFNVREDRSGVVPSAAARAEIARVISLWDACRARFGSGGPWLFGNFSPADAMYAPVALRFLTYGVELPASAAAYAQAVRRHPAVEAWIRDARAEREVLEKFERGRPVPAAVA